MMVKPFLRRRKDKVHSSFDVIVVALLVIWQETVQVKNIVVVMQMAMMQVIVVIVVMMQMGIMQAITVAMMTHYKLC